MTKTELMKGLSKAQMIVLYDDVADYEGHSWTKEEAAGQILSWYEAEPLFAKCVRCIMAGGDATQCYNDYTSDSIMADLDAREEWEGELLSNGDTDLY